MDILKHLPRQNFSDRAYSSIHWVLHCLGVVNAPTIAQQKRIRQSLQSKYGIKTIRYQGALGHIYYVNDLAKIIAQVRYF